MAIYFIEDEVSKLIKIGRSITHRQRISQLKTETGRKHLVLVGLMAQHNYMEQHLHTRFAYLPNKNEWFAPDAELYRYILEHGISGLPEKDQKAATDRIERRLRHLNNPNTDLLIENATLRRLLLAADPDVDNLKRQLSEAQEQIEAMKALVEQAKRDIDAATLSRIQYEVVRDQKLLLQGAYDEARADQQRLQSANNFLISRNMALAKTNNQLRDQLAFAQTPTPSTQEQRAS